MSETLPANQPRRRPRRLLVILIVAVLLLGILVTAAVVILPGLLRTTHHFQGTIALVSSQPDAISGRWNDCSGQGGYSDFRAGAATSITDESGDIVGSLLVENISMARLNELSDDLRPEGLGDNAAEIKANVMKFEKVTCILYFSGEVDEADYYVFTFSDRGEFTYSKKELDSEDWYVELSIGR